MIAHVINEGFSFLLEVINSAVIIINRYHHSDVSKYIFILLQLNNYFTYIILLKFLIIPPN